jgi:hypothetical protein
MPRTSLEPLLTEEHVAEVLDLEPNSLKNARSTGRGDLTTIPWVKVDNWVRYRTRDPEKWLCGAPAPARALEPRRRAPVAVRGRRDVEQILERAAPPHRRRKGRP